MSGLSLRYELPGDHPLTGQRMPDVDLVTQTDSTWPSALFGSGRAVLLDLAEVVPADLRLPARVDLVRATCTDDVGAAALLFRPDGYLCWAADNSAACGKTLLSTIASDLTKVQ
jgi:hypothetical protein